MSKTDHTRYHDSISEHWVENRETDNKPGLTVVSGTRAGQTFELNQDTTVFGRGRDVDRVLPYPSISRRHMMIVRRGNRFIISDLESTNGTFVNREPVIQPVTLFEGDKIVMGEIVFKFSLHDKDDTQFQRRLRSNSVNDPLTGVYHKGYFMESLQKEFDYANRHTSRLSLIILDVDHFKLLNDTYGHSTGDHMLTELAILIEEQRRSYDLFARIEGGKFVIMLRTVDIYASIQLAERIRSLVESKTLDYKNQTVHVTLSLGVATYKGDGTFESTGAFVKAADYQCLLAKQSGRNRVCYED